MPPPSNPAVFHITHVDNLPGIITDGLRCDAEVMARADIAKVGMSKLKARRLTLPVTTHPGLRVGE